MAKKLIFILFIFFSFSVKAQIPKQEVSVDVTIFPKEKVQLSVNSKVLLAGELLNYRAYNLTANGKESKLSKIIYVSLRNENDSVVFSHKLKVGNGAANGDFFIPSSLKTGVYRLIGYTNFSRNNTEENFELKNIYVLNTFVKSEINTENQTDAIFLKQAKTLDPENILRPQQSENLIKIDKASYGYREKAVINIENTTGNIRGDYVLSVRKMNPLEISGSASEGFKNKSSETFYIPEIRGEIISGIVFSKAENIPAVGKEVSLTIPGKDYVFKIAKTNNNGRFSFSVSEGYDAERSIIQLNESVENASNFKLFLDKKDFELGKNILPTIKLDQTLKDWLQERSVQLQIENAYFDVKRDSVFNVEESPAFYQNLGTVFLLDDYTRFPSVRETFIEVVTLAAIRGSGENSRFIVNNEYDPNGSAKFNNLDPLVLVDGIQIQNNSDLLNYNAREIESIRVIIQPYRYGSKLFSGVIVVETKKGDFTPTKVDGYVEELNFAPLAKRKQYYTPNYLSTASLSRIPDYRVQLLWNPSVLLTEKSYSTTFFTSDVSGVYEITFEGFSEEGKYISAKNYFTVSGN